MKELPNRMKKLGFKVDKNHSLVTLTTRIETSSTVEHKAKLRETFFPFSFVCSRSASDEKYWSGASELFSGVIVLSTMHFNNFWTYDADFLTPKYYFMDEADAALAKLMIG